MNREKENEFGYGTQPINSGRVSAQGLASNNAWNSAMNPTGIYSQPSRSGVPPLKETGSKFSSWNINPKADIKPILGAEVDEFLMYENESKTPNQTKKELLSLSGSMDLDNASYDEIEDEMVRGGLDRVKVTINGVT